MKVRCKYQVTKAGVHTNVDVGHDVFSNPIREILTPLSTTDQPVLETQIVECGIEEKEYSYLLSIPARDENRPQGFPATSQQRTKPADSLLNRDCAR